MDEAIVLEDNVSFRVKLEQELDKKKIDRTILVNLTYRGECESSWRQYGGLEIAFCYARVGRMVIVYSFARINHADLMHERVYRWLRNFGGRVVFLAVSPPPSHNWHVPLVKEAARLSSAYNLDQVFSLPAARGYQHAKDHEQPQ